MPQPEAGEPSRSPGCGRVTPGLDFAFHPTSEREGRRRLQAVRSGLRVHAAARTRLSLPCLPPEESDVSGGSREQAVARGDRIRRGRVTELRAAVGASPRKRHASSGRVAGRAGRLGTERCSCCGSPRPPPPRRHPEEVRQPQACRVGQPDGFLQIRFRRPIPPVTPGCPSAPGPGHLPRQRSHHLPRQRTRP